MSTTNPTDTLISDVVALRLKGLSIKAIAKKLHKSDRTVARIVKMAEPDAITALKKPVTKKPLVKKPIAKKTDVPTIDTVFDNLTNAKQALFEDFYEMYIRLLADKDAAIEPCLCPECDSTLIRLLDDAASVGLIEKHILYTAPGFGTTKPPKKAKM